MAGSPRKRARRAGLPVPELGTPARAPARAPAPARAKSTTREAYEERKALLASVLAETCNPVTDPAGASGELLRHFHAKALLDDDVSAAKLVLDLLEGRIAPSRVERARTSTELLASVRAALPELEARARAEAEAEESVTPGVVDTSTTKVEEGQGW
jgi:hypothetical protein